MPTGIIVAGGRSTRFGDRDKALVAVEGTPMIRCVADRLTPVVDSLVVNCRREQRPAIADVLDDCDLDHRFAIDSIPDRGPVAGLQTGMRFAASENAIVVACDMPYVEPDLFEFLVERADKTQNDAVVPRVDDRVQPLCGVYDVDAGRSACTTALARGEPSLRTVFDHLDAHVVDEPTVLEHTSRQALTNVNTPSDLDRSRLRN